MSICDLDRDGGGVIQTYVTLHTYIPTYIHTHNQTITQLSQFVNGLFISINKGVEKLPCLWGLPKCTIMYIVTNNHW